MAIRYAFLLAAAAFVIAGCSYPRDGTPATPLASTVPAADASGYASPFGYCRAVGTIDHPDARYTGPEPPPAVIAGLIKAFGAPPDATSSRAFANGSFWRCMGGRVYACTVGANLPCETKANTNRAPTQGEEQYCRENHDALFIPMYVSGHDTIYDWRCEGAQPVAGKTLSKVDERGYIANIWYVIPPPSPPQH